MFLMREKDEMVNDGKISSSGPFFSVVMPSYHLDAEYIRAAIESVISQTEVSWELIYVDDNPADSPFYRQSIQLSREYSDDPRIAFVFHGSNKGANYARNTAVNNASGLWLAFLDADDRWDSRYLESVRLEISEFAQPCVLVSTPIKIDNGHGIRTMSNTHKNGNVFEDELCGDILSPSSGICVERQRLLEVGSFDVKMPARQDYDMWLRVIRDRCVVFNKEPGVTVTRDGHESISSSMQRHIDGTEIILSKIMQDPAISQDMKQRAISKHVYYIAQRYAWSGQTKMAIACMQRLNAPILFARILCLSFFHPLVSVAKNILRSIAYR